MQQIVKIISGVLIAGLVIWLMSIWWDYIPPDKPNDNFYLNEKLDSMTIEIEFLKEDNKVLSDSVFGLRVEKGYAEVQLNKSKSELDNLYDKYKKAKSSKDTIKVLIIADSLVNEALTNYIPMSEFIMQRANVIDSMQQIQIKICDSIDATCNKIRSQLSADLHKERVNNEIINRKLEKKKKIPVFSAIGGFVAGILAVILIQ